MRLRKFLYFTGHVIVTLILLITTQIGGVMYPVIFLFFKADKNQILKRLSLFLSLYLLASFFVVPYLAPIFGREKIKETPLISTHFFPTKLLNRNYVKPELNQLLEKVSKELNQDYKGIRIVYLDANFPFINGFPLFPHLSHKDGKKVDLAFIYQTPNGQLTNQKKSRTGYGVFVPIKKGEINQNKFCKKKGYFQYDFTKYVSLGNIHPELVLSEKATKDFILLLLQQKGIDKIFIEPNLKHRMHLTDKRIRYQGCHSVRHDDHIHLQIH